MTKVGIYKIGFEVIGESLVAESWEEIIGEVEERTAQPDEPEAIELFDGHKFKSIDQAESELEEVLISDENGQYYNTSLTSKVRREEDIKLAEKYSGQPLIIHVWTVDGRHVLLGTETDPASLTTTNSYKNIQTREVGLKADYATLDGLLRS